MVSATVPALLPDAADASRTAGSAFNAFSSSPRTVTSFVRTSRCSSSPKLVFRWVALMTSSMLALLESYDVPTFFNAWSSFEIPMASSWAALMDNAASPVMPAPMPVSPIPIFFRLAAICSVNDPNAFFAPSALALTRISI